MSISAEAIAQIINGTVVGDPSVTVSGPSKIDDSSPGTITFLANPKYESHIYGTQADIVLVANTFTPKEPIDATLIKVEDVYSSLMVLMGKFGESQKKTYIISEQSSIDKTASLGAEVSVAAFVSIGAQVTIGTGVIIDSNVTIADHVTIGDGVHIHAGARILHDCVIGNHCIIQSNAVIGADGFGYSMDADGVYTKIQHLGNVILEDHVEVGANTTVDRASIGSTILRTGVKLDNLVQVAHNVEIGAHTVMAAQAGVAGSAKLGSKCRVGGQTAIVGHINVGNGVHIQGQSGVISNTKDDARLFGTPAIEYGNYLRSYAVFKQLPHLSKQVSALKKEIENLKNNKD